MNSNMKEWITLSQVHLARVECETKCIDILTNEGMSIRGKDVLPNLNDAIINVKSCVSMIKQYAEKENK